MKRNLFLTTLLIALFLASCQKEEVIITKLVDLDNLLTKPETEWIGDKSGTEVKGDYQTTWENQFSGADNLFVFDNYYSYYPSWNSYSWGGFMITNKSDVTTSSYTNNSAITGKAATGSVYLTANSSSSTPAVISFKEGKSYMVKGLKVTNSTFAYYSILKGDDFAKKFENNDWFKLTIQGYNASNNPTQSVDVYLADYRNGKTEILKSWKWIDLSSLGEVKELHFKLSSTDNGEYGMNTPSYFCLDDIEAIIK